jgi:hypothetical protein
MVVEINDSPFIDENMVDIISINPASSPAMTTAIRQAIAVGESKSGAL